MKQFVKGLPEEGNCFKYLLIKFYHLTTLMQLKVYYKNLKLWDTQWASKLIAKNPKILVQLEEQGEYFHQGIKEME